MTKVSEENAEKYKINEPIQINPGDYVAYKIRLYNNGSIPVQIQVRDRINKRGELKRSFFYTYW